MRTDAQIPCVPTSARRLDLYGVTLELIALCRPFGPRLKRFNRRLGAQLTESLASTLQNLAEAMRRTVQLRDGQEETIHLLERVDEKSCRKLVLHDWLVGAGEPREWKMFLTDTPENQANNIADKVMEKTSQGWVSVKTAALRRLVRRA